MEKHPVPQFATLTGKEKPGAKSVGFRFLPTGSETESKGTLLVNLSLETLEKADLENLSQRLVTSIHEVYFQDSNSTITENLKNALAQSQTELKRLLPSVGIHSLTTEILLAVVLNQFLYLAKTGEEVVYLKRGESISQIKFSSIASGRFNAGDWLILANKNFWQKATPEVLNSLLTTNFEQSLKNVDQLVGSEENISCVLANFQVEEELGAEEKVSFLKLGSRSDPVSSKIQVIALYLLSQLKTLLNKVKAFIFSLSKKLSQAKLTPEPKTAIPQERVNRGSKSKGRWRVLVLVLIVIFSFGLFINLYFKNVATNKNNAAKLVEEAEGELKDAQGLANLNTTKAKELLTEAIKKIDEAKKLNKGIDTVSLQKNIDDLLASIRREYRLAQLPLFYDLSFIKKSISISSLSFNNENLVSLDKSQGTLLILDLKEKKGSVLIEDSRLKNGSKLVIDSNIGYVLVGKEVLRFDFFKKDFISSINLDETAQDIQVYNDSLYVLFSSGLKKAVLTSSGTSSFSNYTRDKEIDFTKSKVLSVDGYVWVGSKDKLLKLSQGEKQDFSISGLEKPISGLDSIYSDESTNYLYLVDSINGRVVVVNKDGVYYSQYINPQVTAATSLLADEAKNRLYVGVGDKIYLLEVKKDNGSN